MLREPAPFVGAASCAPCHPDQYESQQGSRHARTLQRTGALADLPWPDRAVIDPNNPRVTHRIGRAGDRVEAATEVDRRVFRAVVGLCPGVEPPGAIVPGARRSGASPYELRISRYPAAPEWDRTMEHPAVPPDPAGYLGRPVSAESFRKCLHCHATNFRAAREPEGRPEAPRPGHRLRALPRAGRASRAGDRGPLPRTGDRTTPARVGRAGRRALRRLPHRAPLDHAG